MTKVNETKGNLTEGGLKIYLEERSHELPFGVWGKRGKDEKSSIKEDFLGRALPA